MNKIVHLLKRDYARKPHIKDWQIWEASDPAHLISWCGIHVVTTDEELVRLTYDPNKVTCRECKNESALPLLAQIE